MPSFTSSSGQKSRAEANVIPSRSNSAMTLEQETIVAIVGAIAAVPPLDHPQVGPKLEHPPGRVHHVLGDLARHDDLLDALAAKGPDHPPQPGDADELKRIAERAQLFGSLVLDPHAGDAQALPPRRLGKQDRKPAAPRQQADRLDPPGPTPARARCLNWPIALTTRPLLRASCRQPARHDAIAHSVDRIIGLGRARSRARRGRRSAADESCAIPSSNQGRQGSDLGRQLAKLAMHFRQPGDHLEEPALLAHGNGRRAQHVLTVGDVAVHARLGTDDHPVADLRVVLDAGLAGHDDVIAGLAAPGDADLTAKQVVAADLVVVADHHQVVDLGPLADPGGLERRAVDRAIGADLDVVFDFEPPGMRDLHVPAVDLAVAETVASQHAAGVDLHPVAENHVLIKDRVGMDDAIAPELAPLADDRAGMERRAVADHRTVADVSKRIDRHVVADPGRGGDTGLGMNARPARSSVRRSDGCGPPERPTSGRRLR